MLIRRCASRAEQRKGHGYAQARMDIFQLQSGGVACGHRGHDREAKAGDAVTAFKGKALIPGTNLPATTSAQGGGLNVFTYQAGRSFQVTLKADF